MQTLRVNIMRNSQFCFLCSLIIIAANIQIVFPIVAFVSCSFLFIAVVMFFIERNDSKTERDAELFRELELKVLYDHIDTNAGTTGVIVDKRLKFVLPEIVASDAIGNKLTLREALSRKKV